MESLQAAFEEAAEAIDVDVEWSGGYDPAGSDVLSRLTSRQREAIQTAYELGFYEKPRRTSYEEIADALECAPSTANELLRRAETAIVSSVLEG
ncbi:MAG: helix-turn-helix domain-containing protein [Natrialbaceae archaeon]|nr:helix-turn-helix domain-containing protein [Natrialbaceae archaeon]